MPDLYDRMVPRQTIIDKLNRLPREKIIYVCAPAGYGKSVMIRQWLTVSEEASAVVAIDESYNDRACFCARFCEALRLLEPNNAQLLKITGHELFCTAPEEYSLHAIDALCGDNDARIVIDDLHFMTDERTLNLLLVFLGRLPSRFQIALISRNELPIGFSELWMKGTLHLVTAEDLRFSGSEIALLYEKSGQSLTAEQVNDILRFTDGWAIGVGAVLLSGEEPHDGTLELLDDYILNNVWNRWDEKTREFMLKTSVVNELNAPLCFALTGIPDCNALLYDLANKNAFISRISDGVYRYHRLFHAFLRDMLKLKGEKYARSLIDKAGYWHLEQKDFYGAVDCFITGQNSKGIIKCFVFLAVINRGSFIADKLLPILSQPIIRETAQKFPLMYSTLSWAAFAKGRADEMAEYADKYYKKQFSSLHHDPRTLFYIFFTRMIDFRISIKEMMRFADKLPKPFLHIRTGSYQPTIGIINQYMPFLHRGTRDFSECVLPNVETNVDQMLDLMGGLFGDEAVLLANVLKAGLLLEQGRLDKAHSLALAANSEIREDFASETKYLAMSMLIAVLDAFEQYEQADIIAERTSAMIEQDNAYYLNYNFSALLTRRKLGNGDISAARLWLDEHGQDSVDFYRFFGHITTCRAYIALGDYDAAADILSKALELATAYKRPLDMIEANILLSIAYWKKKRTFQTEAIRCLNRAVCLAHEYGYSHAFVNDGSELSGMLRRLQKRAEQQLLEYQVPASFIKLLYLKSQERKSGGLTSGQEEKPIKFTLRQKEIMGLLCGGNSYREICEALNITRPTLRSHIAAIYKKLDVTNETDAVKRISKLNLFPDG